MLKQGRFKKTPERNLSDLDDHLYFLKEDVAKLTGGDTAYIKKIAASLRTLVCLSSGTEGLLWRVVEQLEVDDRLALQTGRAINQNNPITQGLFFALIPVFRAGQGPAAFQNQQISFKKFIKEYDALFYKGKSHTHEKLISSIAQQIGISHESEDVDPYLIDLSSSANSHRPVLVDYLLQKAFFTLEIGERALEAAVEKAGFHRQLRQQIVIPPRKVAPFQFVERDHFQSGDASLSVEGTYAMTVRAPKHGWETDGRPYYLATVQFKNIATHISKYSDGTLEVVVYGLAPTIRIKRAPITSRGKSEIVVILRWNHDKYNIIIEGKID